MKKVTCNRCGVSDLVWHQNKAGNWVLVVPQEHNYDRGVGRWIEPHMCNKIQNIKNDNIAVLEKQIESTKKICIEQGISEEIMNALIAEIELKIAHQKG